MTEFYRKKNVTRVISMCILFSVFFSHFTAAEELAGTVILATGAVSAVGADGKVRVLGKGSPVFSGDRITTATKSLCVLTMIDDAKMTLREESEIVIEEYSYKGKGDDGSLVGFVKGGFRAVTGFIGSNNPDAYKVRSDLGMLGIRGTEFLTRLCETRAASLESGEEEEVVNTCARDALQLGGDKVGVPDGQYTFVAEGGMYMTSDNRIIDILPGQVGFASPTELKVLPDVPGFLSQDPTPSPGKTTESSVPLTSADSCQI